MGVGRVFSGAHCKETGEVRLESRARPPRGAQLAATAPGVKAVHLPGNRARLGGGARPEPGERGGRCQTA